MKHHFISAGVAVVMSLGVAGAMHHFAPAAQLVTKSGKPVPHGWGELSQVEIDALTRILSTMKPAEIAIFCASRDCEDLALDFDNAFKSAHWVSGIEHPLVDSNTSINVGPNDEDGRVLASAIKAATSGRISPGLIESHLVGDRRALVISKRAR